MQMFDDKGRDWVQLYVENDGSAGMISKDAIGNAVGGVLVSAGGKPVSLH